MAESKNESALLIRLPKTLHRALRTRASKEGRSMAALVRFALREYVVREEMK